MPIPILLKGPNNSSLTITRVKSQPNDPSAYFFTGDIAAGDLPEKTVVFAVRDRSIKGLQISAPRVIQARGDTSAYLIALDDIVRLNATKVRELMSQRRMAFQRKLAEFGNKAQRLFRLEEKAPYTVWVEVQDAQLIAQNTYRLKGQVKFPYHRVYEFQMRVTREGSRVLVVQGSTKIPDAPKNSFQQAVMAGELERMMISANNKKVVTTMLPLER